MLTCARGGDRSTGARFYIHVHVALVHTDQESEVFQKKVKTIYCTEFFKQNVEQHPMEPHRAPLGGEGHATDAHESFHGEDTSTKRWPSCSIVGLFPGH